LPLVVVEGDADAVAVHRAAPSCPCYVCDGTRAMRPHAKQELDALAAIALASSSGSSSRAGGGDDGASPATTTTTAIPPQPQKVELVVLTDPDERGRELRAFLDEAFAASGARARHAFVPEQAATKAEDSGGHGGGHAAGNRGIEHAPPKALKAALEAAMPSHPPGRKAFTPEWAREQGLAGAFEGAPHDGGEAAKRRRALCRALGLGQCSSAQMLSALNRYFDVAVVESAVGELGGGARN
jgi:5S rRNA maturation endonuclease (ribonuclease M5)